VDDLVALLAHTDIRAVLEHFGKRNRREDPIVHFYETFLAAYDPKLRQARGVYFTPEPVVSYIVRSVDHILKTRFNLPQGLADTGSVRFRNAAFQAAGAAASRRRSGGQHAHHGSQQDAGGKPREPAFGEVTVRGRGRLPHWEMEGGVYFITFRLADSIPKNVLETLKQEREAAKAAIESGRSLTRADRKRVRDLFSRRVQEYLDSGAGACHLGRPEVARLVGEALQHFDGDRYRLFAWCVMPNHVHVVCDFLGHHGLDDVLHSWKSFTSKKANRILERQGRFWAREYYDHLIRDEDEFYRTLRYVRENPAAAGLEQWPWVWACEDYRDVAGQEPCNAAFQAAGAAASRRRDDGQDARHDSQQDAGVTKEDDRVEAPRVFILDPACGTGTFLYNVVDHIREQFQEEGNAGMWAGYVKKHLLPRLFGFELLMAPYAVAHLKLGMQLAAQDLPEAERETWAYDFSSDERLGVYLTNTLEEAEERAEDLFGPLRVITEEANEANRIKRDLPIMVILGNPPYSGHSSNRSWTTDENGKRVPTFIGGLLQDYYRVDGEPLGERNPKWLQDDYVKFLRWAQWRIERTGAGVLAFITNHGYLDNPTFRGMRQSLMQTFDELHIMDLHGNTLKDERSPDGSEDKNVFDIQPGVAIGLLIKLPEDKAAETGQVLHTHLWGTRAHNPHFSRAS
jgi:REP element-mobilizing transposase RayT